MPLLLSPRALADALGVSESSLKRWIDAGRIRATRTGGGHRRVALPDAIAFIRSSNTPVAKPELLGLSHATAKAVSRASGDVEDRALYEALVGGDVRAMQAWVEARLESGLSVAGLCDGPLRDAMHAVGELWQHDADGVFIEHRASDICIQTLATIRSRVGVPDDAPLALGCAPEDDPYMVPASMAALVLATEGYRTINLGPDTPTSALHRAIAAHRPSIVCMSVSAPLPPSQAHEIADFFATLPGDIASLIGGRNRHLVAQANRNLSFGVAMEDLAALARRRKASP